MSYFFPLDQYQITDNILRTKGKKVCKEFVLITIIFSFSALSDTITNQYVGAARLAR